MRQDNDIGHGTMNRGVAGRIAGIGSPDSLGSYTYQAAVQFGVEMLGWREDAFPAAYVAQSSPSLALRAVIENECQFAIMAVENIRAGFVDGVLDDVYRTAVDSGIRVIDEVYLRIDHALMSLNRDKSAIRSVYSHQQGLLQCAEKLRIMGEAIRGGEGRGGLRLFASQSTDLAANIARSALVDDGVAAIASAKYAAAWGLYVIDDDISDVRGNFTRFWVVANPSGSYVVSDRSHTYRAAVAVRLAHSKGRLREIFNVLRFANMLTVHSRPSLQVAKVSEWEYIFFLEYEAAGPTAVIDALEQQWQERGKSLYLEPPHVLGVYPRRARAG